MGAAEIGPLTYPTRATEAYISELLDSLDTDAIAARGFRIALDYHYSPASVVMPALIGDLGVEMVALNAFVESTPASRGEDRRESLAALGRVVTAMGADMGLLMDNGAERVWLVDEHGNAIDGRTTLLMLLRELASSDRPGDLLVPITETHLVKQVVGDRRQVRRTKASLGALLSEAASNHALFAGASGGGYVFPEFLTAYDAVMSIGKILELVAHSGGEFALSDLVAGLPHSTLVSDEVPCPWSRKGAAMRQVLEAVKGMEVDHTDGVKVTDNGGCSSDHPRPRRAGHPSVCRGIQRRGIPASRAKVQAYAYRSCRGTTL